MGTALMGIDVIYKTIINSQNKNHYAGSNLHLHTISYPFTINNIVIQWSGALIQILNKFLNTALIMIDFGTHRILTLICQRDFSPFVKNAISRSLVAES